MKKSNAVKNTVASRITAGLTRFARDNRGEGYLDWPKAEIPWIFGFARWAKLILTIL